MLRARANGETFVSATMCPRLPESLRPVHSAPEEFENAALFLRLVLPCILIPHENEAFQKTLFQSKKFEITSFSFSCGQKNEAFSRR